MIDLDFAIHVSLFYTTVVVLLFAGQTIWWLFKLFLVSGMSSIGFTNTVVPPKVIPVLRDSAYLTLGYFLNLTIQSSCAVL